MKEELIKLLKKYETYFEGYEEDLSVFNLKDFFDSLKENGFPLSLTDSGATKFVVVLDDTYDFVLKIPIEYDSDVEYYEYDYCDEEVMAYKEIQERGYERFYLENAFLVRIGKIDFYCQEKACTFSEYWYSLDKDTRESKLKSAESLSDQYPSSVFADSWIEDCIEAYGAEKVDDFIRNCPYYLIKDMHRSNFGYTQKGHRPVIIDWGGYEEDSSGYSSYYSDEEEEYDETEE